MGSAAMYSEVLTLTYDKGDDDDGKKDTEKDAKKGMQKIIKF